MQFITHLQHPLRLAYYYSLVVQLLLIHTYICFLHLSLFILHTVRLTTLLSLYWTLFLFVCQKTHHQTTANTANTHRKLSISTLASNNLLTSVSTSRLPYISEKRVWLNLPIVSAHNVLKLFKRVRSQKSWYLGKNFALKSIRVTNKSITTKYTHSYCK